MVRPVDSTAFVSNSTNLPTNGGVADLRPWTMKIGNIQATTLEEDRLTSLVFKWKERLPVRAPLKVPTNIEAWTSGNMLAKLIETDGLKIPNLSMGVTPV